MFCFIVLFLGCSQAADLLVPYQNCRPSSIYYYKPIATRDGGAGQLDVGRPDDYYWRPIANQVGEYWQVDFDELQNVVGVKIQGSGSYWVITFKVEVSIDDLNYALVQPNSFSGNTDSTTVTTIAFSSVVAARYLRILPQTWRSAIRMRSVPIVDRSCPEGQYLSGCAGLSNGTCTGN